MKDFREPPRSCIKANAAGLVKPTGALLLLACAVVFLPRSTAFAEAPARPTTVAPPLPGDDIEPPLPEIQARSYNVSVLKRSASNKVYIFEDSTGQRPLPGRVLLLKKGEEVVMGFRVLKEYPEKRQFAARRIRNYRNHDRIDPGTELLALEKLMDRLPGPILTPSPQEQADLAELEEADDTVTPLSDLPPPAQGSVQRTSAETVEDEGDEPPPDDDETPPPPEEDEDAAPRPRRQHAKAYDPELDVESSPMPENPEADEDDASVKEDDLGVGGLAVEDSALLYPFRHALSGSFGWFRSVSAGLFTAGGARYTHVLKQMPFLRKTRVQDTLSGEVGIFLYKTFLPRPAGGSDNFYVLPITTNLRYTIHSGEALGIFLYGGIMMTPTFYSQDATTENYEKLAGLIPSLGIGFTFRVGPNWDLRTDLGYESISMGMMLSF